MKRLTILGIIVCVGLLFAPAAVIGAPAGPPGGLDVNVVTAIEPVYAYAGAFLDRSCPFNEEVYTVPDGKFLIIEDASGRINSYSTPNAILPVPGVSLSLYVLSDVGTSMKVIVVGGNELPITGGRPLRLYAGPGDIVKLTVEGCDQNVSSDVQFTGQFINAP